jgi:serine/threonine protein kinase
MEKFSLTQEGRMIGKVISHYKILSMLGEGGMGIVYKAQDLKFDRPVALKFLPPELNQNAEAKERFINEAKAASSLKHDNICTIHDIDAMQDGRLFIVMDYYEGQTLKELLGKNGSERLAKEKILEIVIQIAKGLREAHKRGIIHRDIKPANVFITNEGVVKILDFGLAKQGGLTDLTKAGTTLGTVAYMSPEQASGQAIDFLSQLGILYARTGDVEKAQHIDDRLKNTKEKYLEGYNTYGRACMAAVLGQKERAVELLRESFLQGVVYYITLHRDIDLEGLRDYPPFQELMKPKN